MADERAERALCVGRHEKPVTTPRAHLCLGCRDRLYQRLVAIPDLALMVRANTEGLSGQPMDARVSGTPGKALPGSVILGLFGPCSEHITEGEHRADQDGIVPIPDVLTSWVRMICEERELQGPSPDLKHLCSFLREHSEWAADQTWADEFDAEVRECHNRLIGAAGMGVELQRYDKAICPECQAIGSTTYTPGDQSIRCQKSLGGCGGAFDIDSHSAEVIRASQAAAAEGRVYERPKQDDPERSIRGLGADVRDEDYLRADVVWAAKGWPRNNRTQPERAEEAS